MTTPSFLIATWENGLFNVAGTHVRRELTEPTVRGLASGGHGTAFAIVGRSSVRRRSSHGEWTEIATSDLPLSCCVASGNAVYVGTDDARILRMEPDGTLRDLRDFETVAGRETWYAGTALVDGKVMGPPLGIRSMSATCDGAVLLANVHVGGIPRSTDSGATWQPTLDIENDVHQVCAHPNRPDIVIAAAGSGLCISRDAGATWAIERRGLHAHHCTAVAFGSDNVFVAASAEQFSSHGAIYRRPIDSDGALQLVGGGLPAWLDGIADTNCIATRGSTIAVVDRAGCLYMSLDDGASWSRNAHRFPTPSALHVC